MGINGEHRSLVMTQGDTAALVEKGQRYYLPVYRPRHVILRAARAAGSGTSKAAITSISARALRFAASATAIPILLPP